VATAIVIRSMFGFDGERYGGVNIRGAPVPAWCAPWKTFAWYLFWIETARRLSTCVKMNQSRLSP
jgi:hypothetical protein